jgi:hypothetical protein
MLYMQRTLIGLACVIGLVPFTVSAEPVIRSGETVSVDASQSLEGDFYALGSKVTISGEAQYDAYVAGGNITVNAPVAEDLTLVGGTVQVHSDVGDDLRVLGGRVTIGGNVAGDVAVFGGVLTVLSTATIEGDILFFGGTLSMEGNVGGAVHGYAETARINGEVGEDVSLRAPAGLSLGDRTRIQGNVSYTSAIEVARSQNAVVEGEIFKHVVTTPVDTRQMVQDLLVVLLSVLFLAGALILLARERLEFCVADAYGRAGHYGLIGLAVFLALPFLGIVLLVSVVGMPLGILAFSAYAAMSIITIALTVALLGMYFQRLVLKREALGIHTIVLGTAFFALIAAIPFIGLFLLFAVYLIALGALSSHIARLVRS